MKSVAIYEAEAMAAMYSDTTTKDGLAVCASDLYLCGEIILLPL